MSKTLQEILSGDLDLGTTEKVASVQSSNSVIDDEIDKLAAELGFDFNKVAEEDKKEEEEGKKEASEYKDHNEDSKKDHAEEDKEAKKEAMDKKEEDDKKESEKEAMDKKEEDKKDDEESNKEASVSLENLFNTLYPEDASLDKTASEIEKEASEEAVGALAHDLMWERFNNRIEKIASNIKNHGGAGKGIGEDPSFPQELERDADPADQNAIGTDKTEGGEERLNKEERGDAASGHYEGDKLAMAMKKLVLQQALNK